MWAVELKETLKSYLKNYHNKGKSFVKSGGGGGYNTQKAHRVSACQSVCLNDMNSM